MKLNWFVTLCRGGGEAAMESGRRFNLLLLQHHEVLFDSAAVVDLSGEYGKGEQADQQQVQQRAAATQRQDGRLWICSQSVVFEPKDYSRPLERLDFEKMAQAPNVGALVPTGSAAPGDASPSSPSTEQQVIMLEVSSRLEMKRFGKSEPYVCKKETARRIFLLQHRSVDRTLALVEKLWNARHQLLKEPRPARAALEAKLLGPLTESRLAKPFDKSRLHDFREVMLTPKEIRVSLVSQMTDIPGCIMLTDQRLYFQPAQLNNIGQVVQSYPLDRLCAVYKRRYLLRQRALEVRFERQDARSGMDFGGSQGASHVSLLLIFEDGTHIRELVFNLLESYMSANAATREVNRGILFSSNLCIGDNNPYSMRQKLETLRMAWQDREISNFEYLTYLNTLADRSISDLTQYPVFPWVLCDYTSATLNLEDPSVFRDLSKPIGALNAERLQGFKERFHHMQADAAVQASADAHDAGIGDGMPKIPPFLYGTHYTTPGYVLYYLVRKSPDLMLRLQNGQFDRPDRCFHSIASTWDSVLSNTADLKELVPEFYDSDGEFLVNLNQLNLGRRQDGTFVDDVILPPWANSPRDFVSKCRAALESDYVSENLHKWIDLIFGFKQRGQAAVDANNLFYYLTYEGAVDLDRVEDPSERKSYEAQIIEFGQTPRQLFFEPHPGRNEIFEEEFTDDDGSVHQGADEAVEARENGAGQPILDAIGTTGRGEGGAQVRETSGSSSSKNTSKESPTPHGSPVRKPEPSSDTVSADAATTSDLPLASTLKPPSAASSSATTAAPSFSFAQRGFGGAAQGPPASNSSWWNKPDGTIQRYESVREIKAHRGPVSDICASNQDSSVVYSVSLDGSLSKTSLAERAVKRRMAVGKLALGCCTESRAGALLVGSWDNSLYACSLEYGRVVRRILAHDDAVCNVSTNASARVLATGSWESSLKIWSVSSTTGGAANSSKLPGLGIQPSATFYEHDSKITGVEVDSAGHMVVSSSVMGDILLHDLRVGDVVQRFSGCTERGTHAVSVHWTHNETAILACGSDGLVDVYDVSAGGRKGPAGTVDSLLPPGSQVSSAAVTPDRLNVVLGTNCGRLSLCNANLLRNLSARSASRSIWKPSSASAASAKLRKRASGQEYTIFTGGERQREVSDLCVSSLACVDGRNTQDDLILVGQWSGTIKLLKRLQT